MDDFRNERDLLDQSGAAITVKNAEELLKGIENILSNQEGLIRRGEAGRGVVAANMGAAEKYAALIRSHL